MKEDHTAKHVARIGETKYAYKILVVKPERKKKPRGSLRRSSEVREMEREVADRIYLVQDRDQWRTVVDTVIHLRIP
jgi:hypothetical protein